MIKLLLYIINFESLTWKTIVAIKLRRSIFNQTNNLRIPGSLQIIVQNEKRGNISNDFYKICSQRHSFLFTSNQVKESLCQQHNFLPNTRD